MSELKDLQPEVDSALFENKLKAFFNTSIELSVPIAIWRTPNSNKVTAICQSDGSVHSISELENAPSGFLLNPYQDSGDGLSSMFIEGDIYLSSDHPELGFQGNSRNPDFSGEFEKRWIQQLESPSLTLRQKAKNSRANSSDKDDFIALVEKSIEHIQNGVCQKIVPSRIKIVDLKDDFHPVLEMMKLVEAYENAFIYVAYLPGKGIWMGATPELLLSVKDGKEFQTVSLAGTQAVPMDFQLSKAAWTQKEIEEQALVSRYIINCFKKIRLREFEEYGPKTARAANLIHLKTTFKVDMEEVNFPQLGTVMMELLHPTSAVCGMPKEAANHFLKENEKYNRELYSGFLGPVNIENKTSLFVNLRCMKITGNQATLYAGAGVTEDSDPESEWLETEMKFRTLLNIIE